MPETTTYSPTRPIMSAAELREHHADQHGRYHGLSDDGIDDAEINERQGWKTCYMWGSDGWDLGDWPYVALSIRKRGDEFQLLSVVEGDHDVYSFDSLGDLHAALDYLFLWYRAEDAEHLFGFTVDREALDAGLVTVDDRFRGPYRTES